MPTFSGQKREIYWYTQGYKRIYKRVSQELTFLSSLKKRGLHPLFIGVGSRINSNLTDSRPAGRPYRSTATRVWSTGCGRPLRALIFCRTYWKDQTTDQTTDPMGFLFTIQVGRPLDRPIYWVSHPLCSSVDRPIDWNSVIKFKKKLVHVIDPLYRTSWYLVFPLHNYVIIHDPKVLSCSMMLRVRF